MEESLDEVTAAKEQMKLLELDKERLEEEKKNLDGQISSAKTILDSFEENRVIRQKPNAAKTNGWLKLPERKQRRKKRGRSKLECRESVSTEANILISVYPMPITLQNVHLLWWYFYDHAL
mmetsp:Transcript_3774/g.6967  ORF Transcript_3774/g.6967 Transcript_3774/m.6967 type:complete len:121 (-) Transcript_3774:184-546(-)